jgi:hypothetical protein
MSECDRLLVGVSERSASGIDACSFTPTLSLRPVADLNDRIKAALDRQGISREMVEEHAKRLGGPRRVTVDFNAVQYNRTVVLAIIELMASIPATERA